MRDRYAPRYDGRHWGVWDREKNCWSFYPCGSLEHAQAATEGRNRALEQPVTYRFGDRVKPEPIQIQPSMPHLPDTFEPVPIITSLEMMARMIETMERDRDAALAQLPVQPLSQPIPGALAAHILNRKGRN